MDKKAIAGMALNKVKGRISPEDAPPKPGGAAKARKTKRAGGAKPGEVVRPCVCDCACERDRCCATWYFERVCCFSQHAELYCCGCVLCGESFRCSTELLPCSRWCCVCAPDPDRACGRAVSCCAPVEAARLPGHPKYRARKTSRRAPRDEPTDSMSSASSASSASGGSR